MKWYKLDPESFNPMVFGLHRIDEIQCAKGYGVGEIRLFTRKGWETFAELLDYNPITMKRIRLSQWWIFAAKGVFESGHHNEFVVIKN